MRNRSPFLLIALLALAVGIILPLSAQKSKSPVRRPKPIPAAPAPVQQTPPPIPQDLEVKRLMLKDGSWQGITKYEMKGDRVRYLSSERYDWEELPASLIDWPATEKYAREHIGGTPSKAAQEVDAEAEAERRKEEEQTPLVAPGLRLPITGGVFLLDVFNREAQLIELPQNGGEIKRNTGSNILRSTINPLAGQKQTVELNGLHAQVQSHVADPFIYVNISEDEKAGPIDEKGHFRLVSVQQMPKKNVRVVGEIKIAIYGKVKEAQKSVPVNVERFSGPWLKITPAKPLEPGEYALVEILANNQMNLFVWDFGINPNAQASPGAWRSEAPSQKPAVTETPALSPRQRD